MKTMTKFDEYLHLLKANVPDGYSYYSYGFRGCKLEYHDLVYSVTIMVLHGIDIKVWIIDNLVAAEIYNQYCPELGAALCEVERFKHEYDAKNASDIMRIVLKRQKVYGYKTTKDTFYKYYKYLTDANTIDGLIQLCTGNAAMNGEFITALLHKKEEICGYTDNDALKL